MSTATPPARSLSLFPRRATSARPRWQALVALIAAACVLPIVLVVASLLTPSTEVWSFLVDAGLSTMITTTIALTVLVVAGTTLLGGSLAWLLGRYSFPGYKWFSWLLVLPFAVPAYVSGFVYIAFLDHPGPVQTTLRSLFGDDVWFPEVRSLWLCALVFVFAFYPYVYILARAAIAGQSATTYHAARALGVGPLTAAYRIVLPMARPALAAAGMVVAMESLTDFATVKYFGVSTVSVGVHQVWVGMYNRDAATELAGIVMLFALAVIAAERLARGGARFHQHAGGPPLERVPLTGLKGIAATSVCVLVLAVTVGLPVGQLLLWSNPSETNVGLDARFGGYVANSAGVAFGVAIACVAVGLLLASASRLGGGRATAWLSRAAAIGYAVPGPVIAIGVLVIHVGIQSAAGFFGLNLGASLITGSLIGLFYAYVVRFLALAWGSLDAGLERVSPSITSAALALGARPVRVVRTIHAPLLRRSVGVAIVLVVVDTLKELPIMLLLRPFGFETLAVWVNQLASESRWESVGPPSLTIVAVALIPIILVFRKTLAIQDSSKDAS